MKHNKNELRLVTLCLRGHFGGICSEMHQTCKWTFDEKTKLLSAGAQAAVFG